MELDERKRKILNAIIKTYLETGEPVGSRTISKYTDLNLSSATIRNEMADLEDLGYIIQPHTSAGRIPSDKGYRYYVDTVLAAKDKEINGIKEKFIEKADRLENILEQMAKVLAVNTNYTSMVTASKKSKRAIKFVQLSLVDDYQLLMVIVLEGNTVKNEIIPVDQILDNESVLKCNLVINTFIQGLTLDEISLHLVNKMKSQAVGSEQLIMQVMDVLANVLSAEEETKVYTSGTTNILRYPELNANGKASQLLYTFEEKKQLSEIINDKLSEEENRGIQVYIGDETSVDSMRDCSVVTATYEIEEGVYGKVGILGPKRMDYERVVETLQNLMVSLDEIFKKDRY